MVSWLCSAMTIPITKYVLWMDLVVDVLNDVCNKFLHCNLARIDLWIKAMKYDCIGIFHKTKDFWSGIRDV